MTYLGHIKNGVAVLDTPANLPDGTPVRIDIVGLDSDFWKNKGVVELAQEQAVGTAHYVDELAGDWPEEDSIDEFLALVRKVRH